MSPPPSRAIAGVAVIGTGAIGTSWCIRFLANGLDVVAYDPAPDAAATTRREVSRAWPQQQRLGVADGSEPERLRFAASIEDAVASADFVQENGPERLGDKVELLARIDAATDPAALVASSSSGLRPTELQRECTHPQRVFVGHPFHPPHLIPLVEVVGGAATTAETIAGALAFYRSIGQTPIHVRAELDGHLTNRLQAALWREAYWLVSQGVATVADIDAAIANGPGLRWALTGPFLTQHLSGGHGGIGHALEHLGPPMVEWWRTFETPRWTDELMSAVVDGVADELAGIDPDALVAARDAMLVDLVAAKRAAQHLPS
jgi:3-hydroxyacyl-CoA dehydrogenase